MSERVEIELPDWCKERHIRVFAGIEEVAHKKVGHKWQVKTVRCNKCGECCKNVVFPKSRIDPKTDWCIHLKYYANEYLCDTNRPFFCCGADSVGEKYCCVEWKTIE